MPTLKQKKAFKHAGENGGNISKAMRSAGYTPVTAHHTEKLTQSKGWQELMDEYLPDSLLAKVHQEGLNLKPEHPTRHRYLDSAYKIKDKYPAEKHDVTFGRIPLEEIAKRAESLFNDDSKDNRRPDQKDQHDESSRANSGNKK